MKATILYIPWKSALASIFKKWYAFLLDDNPLLENMVKRRKQRWASRAVGPPPKLVVEDQGIPSQNAQYYFKFKEN